MLYALCVFDNAKNQQQSPQSNKDRGLGWDLFSPSSMMAGRQGEMRGSLKLVFQPDEERGGGAKRMLEEGVLANPKPDVVLATHVWSEKPVGRVDVTAGAVMAAADKWVCRVRGRGGHGAMPHQAVDPIVAAAQIVTGLQTIVSRNVSPLETAVVTVGTVRGGEAFNVIPADVEMSGTIRSYSPDVRELVLDRVGEVMEGVALAGGATAELEITPLTPALVNDPEDVEVVREAALAVGWLNYHHLLYFYTVTLPRGLSCSLGHWIPPRPAAEVSLPADAIPL